MSDFHQKWVPSLLSAIVVCYSITNNRSHTLTNRVPYAATYKWPSMAARCKAGEAIVACVALICICWACLSETTYASLLRSLDSGQRLPFGDPDPPSNPSVQYWSTAAANDSAKAVNGDFLVWM